MQVICLEEPAFYELIDKVVDYIKTTHQVIKSSYDRNLMDEYLEKNTKGTL